MLVVWGKTRKGVQTFCLVAFQRTVISCDLSLMSELHELRHLQHSEPQSRPLTSSPSLDVDGDDPELNFDERDERARMLRTSEDGSGSGGREEKHYPEEAEELVDGSIEALIAKVSSSHRYKLRSKHPEPSIYYFLCRTSQRRTILPFQLSLLEPLSSAPYLPFSALRPSRSSTSRPIHLLIRSTSSFSVCCSLPIVLGTVQHRI
jgi:hypothetical protein